MNAALKMETPAVVQDSRSERKPNSKLPSTKAAGEYTAANETTTGLDRALAAMQRLQAAPGFDPDNFVRWRAEGFAIDFGITYGEAVRLCRETTPRQQASNWNHLWYKGLLIARNEKQLSTRGFNVGLALYMFANPHHCYTWPGRQTIAKWAGWATTNMRGVNGGLNELERINAIRRLKFKNLPVSVLAVAKSDDRKYPRDPRSVCYALLPVEDWKKLDKGQPLPPRSGATLASLKDKKEVQPASPDSSQFSLGDSSLTFPQVDDSLLGTDGSEG